MDPVKAVIAGTGLKMAGQYMEGEQADQLGKNRRRLLKQSGDAAYARGTREAAEIRRQGDMMQSDAAASMAAGGGVTDDAGAIETMGDIHQVANYNAMTALFEGEERRRTDYYEGEAAKWEGRQAKKLSRLSMGATALSGYAKAKSI